MKKLWTKYYLYATLFTWSAYFFVWLCTMFVKLEFINPFYYFMQIPYEDDSYRGSVLGLVLGVEFLKVIYSRIFAEGHWDAKVS